MKSWNYMVCYNFGKEYRSDESALKRHTDYVKTVTAIVKADGKYHADYEHNLYEAFYDGYNKTEG